MPPASVIPPIPTEPVSPNPVASPWAPTAVVYSPAVNPVWAHAVRPAMSMSSPFIVREVQHDASIGGAVTGEAMAAATDGELQPALARE